MDIRINLLPPEILAQQRKQRDRQKLFLAGGLILTLLTAVYGLIFTSTTMTKAEVTRLQKQRVVLEQQVEVNRPYEEMRARVVRTENLIQQAMGSPPDWSGVMAGISMHIPPTVWLTEFTATSRPDDKTGGVTIKGQAYDHSSVAGWLEELRNVPGLDHVLCQVSTRVGSGHDPLISFEIEATLTGGPAAGKAGQ
jgi:type IV pilus assembly protein PilN